MRKKRMADGGKSPEDVARRLVALREALGYSQSGFAKLVGISPSQMNNYEKPIRAPSRPVAQQMRLKTGVTLDWIYEGDRAGLPLSLLEKLPDLSGQVQPKRA